MAYNVFVSYSHKDESYKDQLIVHLNGLVRNDIIKLWDDRQILIGQDWDASIKKKLDESDLVLFLISADFLSSSYIHDVEIKNTLVRHSNGEILFVPIFLRPCDFESSIFSTYQGVPRDARFVSTHSDIDMAFLEVVKELKQLINSFEPQIKKKEIQELILRECDSPPDTARWVGRKQALNILNNNLFKVIFVTGLGGQGKSSLAAEYVSTINKSLLWTYWDWRDFKEEGHRLKTKIIDIIYRFAGKNESLLKIDFSDMPYENIYDIFFETISDKKILFVFDNIDAYIDYEKFLPEKGFNLFIDYALTKHHDCKFIFTCRPFIKQANVGFHQIELSGLTYDESEELLDKYNIGIKSSEKEKLYRGLHSLTKGHPLWLNLLAAQAVRGIGKLEEFIINITRDNRSGSISESSILSEKILGELWNSLNAKQKKLLRCLSELVKSEEKEEIAKIIESELPYNQFTRALNSLKLLNLVVTKTKPDGDEEIELHPLVKNFLKTTLPISDQNKYISIIIDYYDKITYVLKKKLSGNESLNFYEKWTNKVELAVNKKDYKKALITLAEISSSIQTAGYIEEFFRVARLTFNTLNFIKAIENEYPYFTQNLKELVSIASELGEFDFAESLLIRFREVVNNKDYHYIILCELRCKYHWNKFEYKEAVEWGEKGYRLLKQSNPDIKDNIQHTLYLAKRDSLDESYLKEALVYFQNGLPFDEILKSNPEDERPAHFYGNIGRTFFFLKDYNKALVCYCRTFILCYKEEDSDRFLNRGYITYWLGQLLKEMEDYKNSFFFYSVCLSYWKRYSPHRAIKVEEDYNQILEEIPDAKELMKMDTDIIEKQCTMFCEKTIWKV